MYYLEKMLEQMMASVASKEEMQALFFVGLCCLGAWMVLSWIVQMIRSILWIWPLCLVMGILIAIPSLRLTLTQELVPQHVDGFMHLLEKNYESYNNATMHLSTN